MKEVLILFGVILAVLGKLMSRSLARSPGRAERRMEEILLQEKQFSKNQKEGGLCLAEEK